MGGGYLKMEAADGEKASLQSSAIRFDFKSAFVEDILKVHFFSEY